MKKILFFHPALAPYRVDQFNKLSSVFQIKVVFLFTNLWNHQFNQSELKRKLRVQVDYLTKGISFRGRVFRFGVMQKIRDYAPDIIVGYESSFTTQLLILFKLIRLIKIPVGTTIDDNCAMLEKPATWWKYYLRKWTVRNTDFSVVLSNAVADAMTVRYQVSRNKMIVYPIIREEHTLLDRKVACVDIANGYIKKFGLINSMVLLFVGRLIKEKGLQEYISNVASVLLSNPDLKLILVGDGSERDRIIQTAFEKKIQNQLILAGRFEGDELYAWYLVGHGFVLPSLYEPYGAVVNESLVFGLPVLCSKYAGSSTLIGETNGLVFDPCSKDDVIEKTKIFIEKYVNNLERSCDKRLSLMNTYLNDYIQQWSLLAND